MDGFNTPDNVSRRKPSTLTPVTIPATPFMKRLGYGTGVSVYSLIRSSSSGCTRSPWAVKKVNRGHDSTVAYEDLIEKEAKILKLFNHPNIVGYRALVQTADGRRCLAMEECSKSLGDLIETRFEEKLGPFPAENILKLGLDIAKALDYLHTEKHYMHGDLKSFNILVQGDFEISKLCDFGVALPLDENGNLDQVATGPNMRYTGTSCWSAPEVQDLADGPITSAADIFSYGLVLWEMLALHPPHLPGDTSLLLESEESNQPTNIDMDQSLADELDFSYVDKFGTRPELPDSPLGVDYKLVVEVFKLCTEADLHHRPSAQQLVHMLQGAAAQKMEYTSCGNESRIPEDHIEKYKLRSRSVTKASEH